MHGLHLGKVHAAMSALEYKYSHCSALGADNATPIGEIRAPDSGRHRPNQLRHCTYLCFDSHPFYHGQWNSSNAAICQTMRIWDFCKLLLVVSIPYTVPTSAQILQHLIPEEDSRPPGPISIQCQWDVLGPFRIGTRGKARGILLLGREVDL